VTRVQGVAFPATKAGFFALWGWWDVPSLAYFCGMIWTGTWAGPLFFLGTDAEKQSKQHKQHAKRKRITPWECLKIGTLWEPATDCDGLVGLFN
jgi:hypothetical protein